MEVAKKLTSLVYGMSNCPQPPNGISDYLSRAGFTIQLNSTRCFICRIPLDFLLFERARRGKAEIETSHSNPRVHNPENVGFAHRECNIAQGNKTLDEFYSWIREILRRVEEQPHSST